MAGRLAGKRALMIGAASGIGRASAAAFAAEGAALCIADINVAAAGDAVSDLQRSIKTEASALACDVRDEQSVVAAVSGAVEKMGGLDTLVIFAGMMRTGEVTAFEAATWDEIFAVNARGTFLAAKHAVPQLRQAGGGSITTTASLAGFRGAPGMTSYAAAKGAVIAFTTALAQELAADKIRVNSVCPGWIDTPFNDPAIAFMGGPERHGEIVSKLVPLGHQGTPEDVAPMYVYLASDEARYITAKAMMVDGGMAH